MLALACDCLEVLKTTQARLKTRIEVKPRRRGAAMDIRNRAIGALRPDPAFFVELTARFGDRAG
jgi:hypothetical protein